MPRVTGRGFKGRGELETGLNADFEGEVVASFEIVVSDSWGKDAEKFEDTVEIDTWGNCVVGAELPIKPKLECTTAVVALNAISTKVVVIHVELLPDSTDATTDKWLKGGGSRPTENAIQLDRNLNEFTITRIVVGGSITKSYVVLVNWIVDDAGLEADTEPVVNIVAELCIESETWLEGKVL